MVTDPVDLLLWGAWAELGVPSTRWSRALALDPEPLVAHSPHLLQDEPRLLGLVFDWCRIHAAWISATRLAAVAAALPEESRRSFGRFNAALAKGGVRWTPRLEPALPLAPDRTRMALPLDRAGLVCFRIRALSGVSVRADVLARLLAAGDTGDVAAALTGAGVARRSVERVLAELTLAGLVVRSGGDRNGRFRLVDPESFRRLVRAEGVLWPDWSRVFELAGAVRDVQSATLSPGLRRLHAMELAERLVRLGHAVPPQLSGQDDPAGVLLDWMLGEIREVVGG